MPGELSLACADTADALDRHESVPGELLPPIQPHADRVAASRALLDEGLIAFAVIFFAVVAGAGAAVVGALPGWSIRRRDPLFASPEAVA